MVYHGNRHTPEQLRTLILEVAKNPSLCNETMFFDEQWMDLAETLNALSGPTKSVSQWKSILQDWKNLTEEVKEYLHNDRNDIEGLDDLLSRPLDEESLGQFETIIRKERAKSLAGQSTELSYLDDLFKPAEETPLKKNVKKLTKKMEKERRRNLRKKKTNSYKQSFVRTDQNQTIVRTNDSISITYSPADLENSHSNVENEEPVLMLYPSTSEDSVVTPQGVTPSSKRIIIAREQDSNYFRNSLAKKEKCQPFYSKVNAPNGNRLKIFFDDLDGTREDLSEYEEMKLEKLQEVTRDLEQHISSIQDRIQFIKDLWMHRCGSN